MNHHHSSPIMNPEGIDEAVMQVLEQRGEGHGLHLGLMRVKLPGRGWPMDPMGIPWGSGVRPLVVGGCFSGQRWGCFRERWVVWEFPGRKMGQGDLRISELKNEWFENFRPEKWWFNEPRWWFQPEKWSFHQQSWGFRKWAKERFDGLKGWGWSGKHDESYFFLDI